MNMQVTRAADGLDRRALTIADMERMVEVGILAPDGRVELIGGSWCRCPRKAPSRSDQGRAQSPMGPRLP